MKLLMKSLLGAVATMAATASQASASCLLGIVCLGGAPNTPAPAPSTPGPSGAPEIDVTQGVAAIAILVCAVLILRERFIRQRA